MVAVMPLEPLYVILPPVVAVICEEAPATHTPAINTGVPAVAITVAAELPCSVARLEVLVSAMVFPPVNSHDLSVGKTLLKAALAAPPSKKGDLTLPN